MAEILSDKRKQLLGLKKKMEEFMPANKIFNGEIIEIKEGYVKTLFPFNKKFIGNYKKKFGLEVFCLVLLIG
jgi:acyl-coenzyme A thioesterase PaaI-like protein